MSQKKFSPWKAVLFMAVGVVAAGALAFFALFGGAMKTVPTGKVGGTVYAVKSGMVNFYVVDCGGALACVDAGVSPEDGLKGLRQLGLDPARVSAVFLTHSDRDHAGGIRAFPNASVYLPEKEEPLVTGKDPRRIMGRLQTNSFVGAYALVRDGETVAVGDSIFRAIWTPGHTPGSTCYLVNGYYLFTGDTLMFRDGKAVLGPAMFNQDPSMISNSIRSLATNLEGVGMVLTAHGGLSSNWSEAFAGFR